jgi:hypothetical protein
MADLPDNVIRLPDIGRRHVDMSSTTRAKCAAMDMKLKLPLPITSSSVQIMAIRERSRRLQRKPGYLRANTLSTPILLSKLHHSISLSESHLRYSKKFVPDYGNSPQEYSSRVADASDTVLATSKTDSFLNNTFEALQSLSERFWEVQKRPSAESHDERDEAVSVVPKCPQIGQTCASESESSTCNQAISSIQTDYDWDVSLLKSNSQWAKEKRDLLFSNLLRHHVSLFRKKVALEKQVDKLLARYGNTTTTSKHRGSLVETNLKLKQLNTVLDEVIGSSARHAKQYRSAKSQAERTVMEGTTSNSSGTKSRTKENMNLGDAKNMKLGNAKKSLVNTNLKLEQLGTVFDEVIASSVSDAKRYRSAKSQAEQRVMEGRGPGECGVGVMLVPVIAQRWRNKAKRTQLRNAVAA